GPGRSNNGPAALNPLPDGNRPPTLLPADVGFVPWSPPRSRNVRVSVRHQPSPRILPAAQPADRPVPAPLHGRLRALVRAHLPRGKAQPGRLGGLRAPPGAVPPRPSGRRGSPCAQIGRPSWGEEGRPRTGSDELRKR